MESATPNFVARTGNATLTNVTIIYDVCSLTSLARYRGGMRHGREYRPHKNWLFLINVPFGIFAFILGKRLLLQNPQKGSKAKFDWISALENAATFGLIFYVMGSLARNGEYGLNSGLLVAGFIVGFIYLRRELHSNTPMLPVDLFRIKLYSLSICTSISSFIAQIVAMVFLPFLLMGNFHFSEISTGLLMTPRPLATMIVSPLAARFIEKHNPGATAAVGMAVFSTGLLMLLFSSEAPHEWEIAWRMAICGIGFGLFQTPNNIVMVLVTPIQRTDSAGGMQSTARLIGQTMGATLVTLIFAIFNSNGNSVSLCLSLLLLLRDYSAFAALPGSTTDGTTRRLYPMRANRRTKTAFAD